ncbi:hypothetical protein [Dendrosporobacter sp. 1207_IL3150]|uniref:hypothetical protein n=1 Tax=Dendrosporobacter sp. 1207_IL3150 TaxID=3084054 RepID=UPI002FDB0A93
MKPVILYPPTIDWDYLHQRPQQLLKALSSLGCVCIFCNPNLHKQRIRGIQYLSESIILANEVSYDTALQWARDSFPSTPIAAYFTYPQHITYIAQSKVDLIIFDSVDKPVDEFAVWNTHYKYAVQNSDIRSASALSLVKRASTYTDAPIHYIPNGCDFEHFKKAQIHQQLNGKPFSSGKSIIGYIGAIAPWVDWQLVNYMAHCLPSYEFVFIGSALLQKGICMTNSNMHYLGHKDYSELPVYMSNFDFCLLPFKITDMTRGVNPIKFWEYLASGKPILSTALPEIPPAHVSIINEDLFPGYQPNLDVAGRESRIELARNNSWKERAAKLLQVIYETLECG